MRLVPSWMKCCGQPPPRDSGCIAAHLWIAQAGRPGCRHASPAPTLPPAATAASAAAILASRVTQEAPARAGGRPATATLDVSSHHGELRHLQRRVARGRQHSDPAGSPKRIDPSSRDMLTQHRSAAAEPQKPAAGHARGVLPVHRLQQPALAGGVGMGLVANLGL